MQVGMLDRIAVPNPNKAQRFSVWKSYDRMRTMVAMPTSVSLAACLRTSKMGFYSMLSFILFLSHLITCPFSMLACKYYSNVPLKQLSRH